MASLQAPELARAAVYQLFGGLLLECASEGALRDVHEKALLPELATRCATEASSRALLRMHAELASDQTIERIRADYASLFLGVGKSKAPPWESVYRSTDRLVWQEPAYRVLEHYARAGFGYDDMKAVPPDHVGRELLFVATLLAEVASTEEPERGALVAACRAFLDEHLLAWVSRFTADVKTHATTEFFRALADGLEAQLGAERGVADARPSA
jgi:TorA maturation chaperone TorD